MRSQKSWLVFIFLIAAIWYLTVPTGGDGELRTHLEVDKKSRSIVIVMPAGEKTDDTQNQIDNSARLAALSHGNSTYKRWDYSTTSYVDTPVNQEPESNEGGDTSSIVIGFIMIVLFILLFMANRRLGIRME
jgi:hypothetical protein